MTAPNQDAALNAGQLVHDFQGRKRTTFAAVL